MSLFGRKHFDVLDIFAEAEPRQGAISATNLEFVGGPKFVYVTFTFSQLTL